MQNKQTINQNNQLDIKASLSLDNSIAVMLVKRMLAQLKLVNVGLAGDLDANSRRELEVIKASLEANLELN